MSNSTKERALARLLPAETLHQLIRDRGLDACSELVTLATPAQLTVLLDLDLWRGEQPGRDHRFDADRFGEWLEVLVDAGESAAARTVAGLEKNLVAAGLSLYVRVLDPGIFEPIAQSDDEPADRYDAMREGGGGSLECEVGGYIVRARRADSWDAVVTLLVALDAEYGNDFHAVMQRCRRLSNSRSEVDDLDDLLRAPEQHLLDVTIERERRRAQQGYATPADARAFLQLARRPEHARSAASIVAAYFRDADQPPESLTSPHATDVTESLAASMKLLTEAGFMPEPPRALLEATDAGPKVARLTRLRQLMSYVRDTNETAYFTRTRELAFLANTLLAGCSVQSRSFTQAEASGAAAAICNLGLEYWPEPAPDSLLIDRELVAAFEVGWSVLHHDVSLFVADQLISTLAHVDCIDRDIRFGLAGLRRTLGKHREAGTPWLARDAVEILAMLDMPVWISVLGLLDECPVLPAALTAVLEGRTTTIRPTEFEFISTAAQIADVRAFMRKVPDLLSR